MSTAPPGVGVVTVRHCEPGQFACLSGECVPVTALCNGKLDCTDHSDELGCGESEYFTIAKSQFHSFCALTEILSCLIDPCFFNFYAYVDYFYLFKYYELLSKLF